MRIISLIITFFLFFSLIFLVFAKKIEAFESNGREDSTFLNAKNSNFKKGKDSLNQAIKLKKKNKLKKAEKRFEKSLRYFLSAYKERPDNIQVLTHLGYTYFEIGDLIMSEIYYQEGLKIDPKNNTINQRLGELYFKSNKFDLAKERLNVLNSCNCEEYLSLKKIIQEN